MPSAQGELTLNSGGGSHLAPSVSSWEFSFSHVGEISRAGGLSQPTGDADWEFQHTSRLISAPPGLPSPLPIQVRTPQPVDLSPLVCLLLVGFPEDGNGRALGELTSPRERRLSDCPSGQTARLARSQHL